MALLHGSLTALSNVKTNPRFMH